MGAADKSAALAALRDKRLKQAKNRSASPEKTRPPQAETTSSGIAYHASAIPRSSKILAPESSPSGPESKYYGGNTASHAIPGHGAAAIRHNLFGDTLDIATQSLNKPRKQQQMTQAEREAAARSEQVMQGLLGMAGSGGGGGGGGGHVSSSSGIPARPDSRASTHDNDGLPPRKKQAVAPASTTTSEGARTPSSPTFGSRSGSAAALPGRMASGLRVSTPGHSDEEERMRGSLTPPVVGVGFGSGGGPQRVSLAARGAGVNGGNGTGSGSFSAAVSTPNRTRLPGTGFTTGGSMSSSEVLNPDRLKIMFPQVPTQVIEETIIDYGDEPPVEIIKRIRAAQTGVPYRAPGVASVKTIRAVATRAPVPLSSPTSEPAFSTPGKPTPTPARKNPKVVSAIYANRRERRPTQVAIDVGSASSPPTAVAKPKTIDVVSDEEAVTEDDDSDTEGARKGKGKMEVDEDGQDMDEVKALEVFNTCTAETLTGTIVCSAEQAEIIISLRPFATVEELRKKLTKRKGVSFGLFEQYIEVIQGYIEVDRCLTKCENIGKEIAETVEIWTGSSRGARSRTGTPDGGGAGTVGLSQDTGLHVTSVDVDKIKAEIMTEQDKKRRATLKTFVTEQPKTLAKGVVLKDYQLLGVNWLNLLYTKDLSCILADDMGLGKTMQVISFLTLLRERGSKGPHLIIVPSSTLENWVREFQKFSPQIDVRTYYGSQNERFNLRDEYRAMADNDELEVLLTTYDMAWKPDDNKFLRKKIQFDCCIFDEGHTLKNFESQRYKSLIQIRSNWRVLLTGTPLQNNLQELVSLLNFIHEDIFEEAEEHLRQIFKVHNKGSANMLSQQRVSRARAMMTPFVLRRRKVQVLKDLPPKTDKVIECEMPASQKKLYLETLRRSSSALAQQNLLEGEADGKPKRGRKAVLEKKNDASANILMDLRKAALHPLLFRKVYDDKKIRTVARDCMLEPEFATSNFDLIVEDMEVMTDAELFFFCQRYKSVNHHTISSKHFMDVAKVKALKKVLEDSDKEGKRILLFSQFTQMLDILQVILSNLGFRYIRLDGSTKVDERQGLVDEFTNDPDIKVFLLSTKAGGMGINLVAASVVCIFDQDFNPHNDRQAADRAYRIGQTREVEVIKLLTRNTIDEDIYRIGITKLRLDDAVGGTGGGSASVPGLAGDATAPQADATGAMDDTRAQNEVKKSLLNTLRQKLVDEEGKVRDVTEDVLTNGDDAAEGEGKVDEAGVVHVKVE
ncbi:hypothetical protein NliqN6_3287 [Naganishia liquefaciens]|uniref:DNA helicase n=1 Tax=Naganishia liquefaciens TaxID=104408 RepID=A0A8H3TTD3_9TREE|nr:hypothetical protein NliqN6_3287 [Naganishia liquefaciens]